MLDSAGRCSAGLPALHDARHTFSQDKRPRRRRRLLPSSRPRVMILSPAIILWDLVRRAYLVSVLLVALCHQRFRGVLGRDALYEGAFGQGDTFYDVLGVSQLASQEHIKRVFRKVAVRMHPDKRGPFDSPEAEAKANDLFVKILKAYETLGDPVLRQKYDLSGMKEDAVDPVVQEDAGPRYEDAPFGVFIRFGGGRGGMWFRYKGHGARRAPDVVIPLQLTFEEAFEGKTANVTVTRETLCRSCGATGSANPEGMATCPLCHGKGYAYHLFGVYESEDTESGGNYEHNHHHHHHDSHGSRHCAARGNSAQGGGGGDREEGEGSMPGYAHAVNTTCKACGGMGKLSDGDCPLCGGKRVIVETDTYEVTMPAGAVPGHTVTLGGRGYEHPDKAPGNVRVVAVQLGHPRFDREGANLLYRARVSLVDALLGFERKLTLLNGVRVPIVHDQVTLSGFRQEIAGLGFPVMGKDGEHGALVVVFEVDFPTRLSEAHLAVLRGVLTEEEIKILEDVLTLMSAGKKGQEQRHPMDPLERQFSRHCSDREPPVCVPDPLWWARSCSAPVGEDILQPR